MHQLEIEVLDIVDARLNHEVYLRLVCHVVQEYFTAA